MLPYLSDPAPEDILPREIVFNHDVSTLAAAMLPWARRNPRFTYLCAIWLSGLKPYDVGHRRDLTVKVKDAMLRLGCDVVEIDGHHKIWFFPDRVGDLKPDVPTRVTRLGYSEKADIAPPQEFQVEVCRTWLREHARPTKEVRSKFSSDGMRHLVMIWTEKTGAYREVDQVDEEDGEIFRADRVFITSGAFIQAALDEGYRAKRVFPDCADAKFNLSHRATGAKWRGRPPKRARLLKTITVPAPPRARRVAKGRRVKIGDLVTPELARGRLEAFLQVRLTKARAANEHPLFTLEAAARATGVPYTGGRVPAVLMRALRGTGCRTRLLLLKGKRSRWWFRAKDMPAYWSAS